MGCRQLTFGLEQLRVPIPAARRKDAIPFTVWLFSARAEAKEIITQERAPRFDVSLMTLILGGYCSISRRLACPTQLGFPATWPRRWSVSLPKSKLQPCFEMSSPGFEDIYFRHCKLDGSVFFQAPLYKRSAEVENTARCRKLLPQQATGLAWPLSRAQPCACVGTKL